VGALASAAGWGGCSASTVQALTMQPIAKCRWPGEAALSGGSQICWRRTHGLLGAPATRRRDAGVAGGGWLEALCVFYPGAARWMRRRRLGAGVAL